MPLMLFVKELGTSELPDESEKEEWEDVKSYGQCKVL